MHPLIMAALKNIQPAINREAAKLKSATPVLKERDDWLLSSDEYYTDKVFRAVGNVGAIFDQLKRALFYLGSNAITQSKNEKPPRFNEWTWLEYHVSYYVVMYAGLLDATLILVNEIYGLGNPPENCRPEIIKKNANVPRTVVDALNAINQCVEKLRQVRNCLLHHGRNVDVPKMMNSENLATLELICHAAACSHDYQEPQIFPNVLEKATVKLRATLEGYAEEATVGVKKLMDILLPVYLQNVDQLKAGIR